MQVSSAKYYQVLWLKQIEPQSLVKLKVNEIIAFIVNNNSSDFQSKV